MAESRLVLRATWSSRLAGTYTWAVGAIALLVAGVAVFDGWWGTLLVAVGVSLACRALLRWGSTSLVCTPDRMVYRRSVRRVAVPFDGVAAVTVRPQPFTWSRGRGVAIRPDRPLASLPVPLVSDAAAERFAAWVVEHRPEVPINPTGTWQDRFGRWHVDVGGVDAYGILQIGLRPLEVGDVAIDVETVDDGTRAVRRDAPSGEIAEHGPTRADRREAVADAVDMYRHALADRR